LSITSRKGRSTPMTRGVRRFRSSRTKCSSRDSSITPLVFATPMRSQKLRIASGVYPRRRIPESVGIRGSFQPLTWPFCTSVSSLRLLINV
jgi:hypothetical protein